jgi:membrane protein YqaA with SNARE-associated domain
LEFLATYGLIGLFLAAFLAATILPFSSEALLILLIGQGGNWLFLLICASAGNILGSVVNYYLGIYGDKFIFYRVFRMKEQTVVKAKQRFQTYGVYSLLLAWVPVIGDPLTLAAGVFRVKFMIFILLVALGKIGRYAFLVFAYSAV